MKKISTRSEERRVGKEERKRVKGEREKEGQEEGLFPRPFFAL